MKNIKFLRRAQSAGKIGLPLSSPGEIPLTEEDRRAAEEAARNFEGRPPDQTPNAETSALDTRRTVFRTGVI